VRVAVFDYGAGNLHSLAKALELTDARVEITSDWDVALGLDALVLPGVGAYGPAVSSLGSRHEDVRTALSQGLPCLGICLGMQLLMDGSDEAEGPGIGLIPGRAQRLNASVVPHMGWNDVQTGPDPLFNDAEGVVAFYANSYVCRPEQEDSVIAWTDYDGDRFAAGIRAGRTWGVQFHPEKSSRDGLRLIANFLVLAEGSV